MTRLGLVLGCALLLACKAQRLSPPPQVPETEARESTRAARPLERVVIVTIDGLRPVDVLRFPTLARLAREGAFAAPPEGALSVLPSVTYPAHTTIATGALPDRHGITTNLAPDPTPDQKNYEGWRWYREDVRAVPLYDLALAAGLRTALVDWPVTVGARATLLLPEYWRAGTREDVKLSRALSTTGLFDEITRRHPNFSALFTPPHVQDEAGVDAALTALELTSPHLLMLHIWQTDDAQHHFGPDSPEANAALSNADAQLGRLLDALARAPEWSHTVLVVASDHGFARIEKAVVLHLHLAKADLLESVFLNIGGGFAYAYLRPDASADAAERTRALFTGLAADPSQGIGRVLDREAIAQGGGDPEAFLGLEAAPGFMFSRARTGDATIIPTKDRGSHGYLPERPEMRATLLMYGPRLSPTKLVGARLVDIAPTVAPWLGLTLPNTQGRPLPVTLRAR